jgi:hypothetical protein
MKKPVDNLKKILSELGPKPGRVAINVACLFMIPPLAALLYSFVDAQTSKILLLLIIPTYVLAIIVLPILEVQFKLVTKFLRTKIGHFLFCK